MGTTKPTLCSRSIKGRCYGNRFLARIGKKWHIPLSFCALAFHKGWENRNTDMRLNIADDPSTSDKNWVNFGPVTPTFCRLLHTSLVYFVLLSTRNVRERSRLTSRVTALGGSWRSCVVGFVDAATPNHWKCVGSRRFLANVNPGRVVDAGGGGGGWAA